MILITGSNGFLGTHLVERLEGKSLSLVERESFCANSLNRYTQAEIGRSTDYTDALLDCKVVIHCAARVHIMDDLSIDSLGAYREVNTAGTINLARQAVKAGVKRFIFISSIKVNGEHSNQNRPFCSNDPHSFEDFYGQSKSEAELELQRLSIETGLEVVIIRPTLVYGPGVKANFASLMNLVSKGIPLPFGCITKNKRSLVSVDNLVDLIITCIDHPKAANQVFLVSDDHDVSTAEMVRELAIALDKPTWQLPVPIWCYKLFGKLFGKSDIVDRLTGSLQVDISHTKETLGWKPPQTLQEGFKQTAQAFLQANNR
ncbi:UDP-glucose 4-epimerase [Vibrio cholerae]|uniref:UDP-glucose 4-epimerase family protein n=1 Tax=Vibrio TaxID=662 RepID=UPI000A10FB96|nr:MULTISPECIES: SDR family oxidoreductase [Vibrio]EGR4262117.1 SDR family oxidoreductase [Vibrio cholerae]ORP25546.1 UDP-glucose 4-epimerase [Vibrio paracholerae]TXX92812.1 SDR family oxidoreductase [Vibrio cholerae]BCN18150.1 putative epimerase [Vibrio cholerae]GHW44137.1 UDP-glucose 4-epimerase [Vibrio cholerae]